MASDVKLSANLVSSSVIGVLPELIDRKVHWNYRLIQEVSI
jgi:hypothetical protein